jgi:esterase/lipase superfamily enzyme
MKPFKLVFATNRNHEGTDRWNPTGYGRKFSSEGRQNLRFGEISLEVDKPTINQYLNAVTGGRKGDGEGLSEYLSTKSKTATIKAYDDPTIGGQTEKASLASTKTFNQLKEKMMKTMDVVIYIHGFNVDWNEAVGAAAALQLMLNRNNEAEKEVMVVLFSWPSNGSMFPYRAYLSDRHEARDSGLAIGRALLKLRDYMIDLRKQNAVLCNQDIHLLCHSMGNYALQSALKTLVYEGGKGRLPRLFDHIFMCSPDLDNNVFEKGGPMERLEETCAQIAIYFNKGDVAMYISDYTKANPDRLGHIGVSNPYAVNKKISQIRCTPIVHGIEEHSYYLWATVNDDIRQCIDGIAAEDPIRKRKQDGSPREWVLK